MENQQQIRSLKGIQQSFLPTQEDISVGLLAPQGAVYTKRWVVDLVLDLAGYTSDRNLADLVAIEPSVGTGAFFEAMIERLLESCVRFDRNIGECRESLIAFELDSKSAEASRRAAVRVLEAAHVPDGLARELSETWVRSGDYLLDTLSLRADFVLGNPPYVRLEEIPVATAELYRQLYPTMRGRADLYIAFYEAALCQLKNGGTCAFICADRWMRNQYGTELRRLVTSSFSVDAIVEMHDAEAFEDEVDAYPAITVIRRQPQGQTIVASLNADAERLSSSQRMAGFFPCNTKQTATHAEVHVARVDTWFSNGDPWPCNSPEQLTLLRRLEVEFPPLEKEAKVGIGVASGMDSVFITKEKDLVEPSRLLKLALAKDLRSGTMAWSGHYLVDPWNGEGLVSLDNYPRLQAYFKNFEEPLKARHTALKSISGWYKTIDRVNHSLTGKPKLYIADIKEKLDPVLDKGETYPHHNLYYLESDQWDLEALGGILISAIGQFFVDAYGVKMRGGYLRFQAQYLRRIRVPFFDSLTVETREKLVAAFRMRDRSMATQITCELYGLSPQELEIALGHR